MSARRFRPRRRLRSEIVPLASVGLVSLTLVGLFPNDLLRLAGRVRAAVRTEEPVRAGCAFVTLDPARERSALAAARTSWQSGPALATRRRIEMLPAELPAPAYAPAAGLAPKDADEGLGRAKPDVSLDPPTAAAPRPAPIAPDAPVAPSPAFPRETMLRLH